MSAKKLSICIATFKRGKFLGETLETIVGQLTPEVELIVLDGASPDNTQELMEQYQRRYPQIRYIREATNSGIDQDYDKAVGYATGDYCWLMTDDDLLRTGALARVLSELKENRDLVIVNAEVGELKGQARIRVIPEITKETPWSFDFNDGLVPVTGVGMRYRHIAIDHDYFTALKKDDPLAARLYIYLTTQFTNVPAPKTTFDDSTPVQAFTGLKRYLGMIEAITTQDQGKEKLDPPLKRLQDDDVIAKFEWTGNDKIPIQLVVEKGPRKITGNGVMCKITTIPRGTKSQGWLGHPGSKDYVIQADFMANDVAAGADADKNSKLPDVGVQNQRYRFGMLGAKQHLKLYSWFPHDQKSHEAPFASKSPWR